jgi:hypothetical protein
LVVFAGSLSQQKQPDAEVLIPLADPILLTIKANKR